MLRTEDEARKCWCPLARAAVSDDHQTANFGENLMRGRSSMACIASECMAWRFLDYVDDDGKVWGVTFYAPGRGHSAKRMDAPAMRRGFCGLAGNGS